METFRHPASCINDKPGSLREEDYIPDRWYTRLFPKYTSPVDTHLTGKRLFLILLKILSKVKYKMH
jgi:hypothetical protein